jgi:hypothetical protein
MADTRLTILSPAEASALYAPKATTVTSGQMQSAIEAAVSAIPLPPLPVDAGEDFAQKLRYGIGNPQLGVAGDSTGNASNEWPSLLVDKLAADYPAVGFRRQLVDEATDVYGTETVVSAGQGSTGTTTTAADTFDGTGDLLGSTTTSGHVWSGASNAGGDWTRGGGVITRSADTVQSDLILDGGLAGDMAVYWTGLTMSTETPTTQRFRRLYAKYLTSQNHVFVAIQVSTTGIVTTSIVKRIANTATTLTSANGHLPSAQASTTFDASISVVGLTVTAIVNGNTISATLTQADADALSAASALGLGSSNDVGGTASAVRIDILGSATAAQTVKLWCGSKSGSTLQWQQDRLAALYPVPLDLLFISSIHNYGSDSPAQWQAKVDTFVAAFRKVQPTCGIVIVSQNPQKPGSLAVSRAAHMARAMSARSYARRRGFGYAPTIEAFLARGDKGVSLILPDGIHPTTGEAPASAPTGSSLWRDAVRTFLSGLGV